MKLQEFRHKIIIETERNSHMGGENVVPNTVVKTLIQGEVYDVVDVEFEYVTEDSEHILWLKVEG